MPTSTNAPRGCRCSRSTPSVALPSRALLSGLQHRRRDNFQTWIAEVPICSAIVSTEDEDSSLTRYAGGNVILRLQPHRARDRKISDSVLNERLAWHANS